MPIKSLFEPALIMVQSTAMSVTNLSVSSNLPPKRGSAYLFCCCEVGQPLAGANSQHRTILVPEGAVLRVEELGVG